ncbi:MAG TPA: CoA transferase [Trebonia sp.]|jgi:crotonobetainyl-CoA:carnitine CoA-transferase CaiB-like acyl-CoA transferase
MSGIPEPGPLHGIRVADFGHQIAGPLTAVMLADQGADVVHIDAPGAAAADEPADAFFSRGKRRITLDLKQPDDLATARALIARSDVLIENFRPGVMSRLGLGYAELSAASPRLVYCSLPGFGATDPRAGLPGWEGVIDAATGNCRIRAGEAPERWDTSRPTYSSVPGASTAAAFLAAVAVVSALVERHSSGRGQHIEVPLFDAVFEVIGDAGAYVTARGLSPQLPLAKYGSGTYRCRDGRYVQFNPIGATSRFVSWFLRAAGKPEWAVTLDDEAELRGRLTQLFATRTAADWERLGHEAGVPLSRIRTAAEWLATPHAQAGGEVVRLEDPVLGRTWMAGIPVHAAPVADSEVPDARGLDRPLSPRHRPDADREQVLAELAAGGPQAATPQAGQAAHAGQAPSAVGVRERPMTGLRVLDLTQILAGPSSARILGELGAEVIKINAPHRKIFAHGVINRGKKSILLDVQNPAGQDVFWRLVADADVIVQNFPPGTAERYGIGYDDVAIRKPAIVYVSVSCYGSAGPWAPGRGYETQGQAVTGIMARAGGDGGRPAVLGPYNFLDYGTGVLAAFAAALGVYQRTVTGQGRHLRTSLAQAGTYYQARYLLDYQGKTWTEPAGPGALGEGPLQRFYRASDGWFFLGATEADLTRLSGVPGLEFTVEASSGETGGGTADAEELGKLLEERFQAGSAAAWVAALQAAGLGAHEVVGLAALMTDPRVRGRRMSVTQVSPEAGEVTMPGIAIKMSATPPRLGAPARQPGADAREVLQLASRAELAGLTEPLRSLGELEQLWAVQATGLPAGWETMTGPQGTAKEV